MYVIKKLSIDPLFLSNVRLKSDIYIKTIILERLNIYDIAIKLIKRKGKRVFF